MKKALLAWLVACLLLTALAPIADGSTSLGSGTDRRVELYTTNLTASVPLPTVLDNSTNISFVVTFTNNYTANISALLTINITSNGTYFEANTSDVNVPFGDTAIGYVNCTADTLAAYENATVNITLETDEPGVDWWEGEVKLAFGNDYQMAYAVAMLMAVLPVVVMVIAFVAVINVVMVKSKH